MSRGRLGLVLGMLVLIAASTDVRAAQSPPGAGQGVRDARYCEILPVVMRDGQLVALVFNTLGQNDCPAAAWDAMDPEAIRQQFGAVAVLMNGPRYWVMDRIVGRGATQAGETVTIGGIGFTERAEIAMTPDAMESTPYVVREILRDTEYTFEAGKPVYELVSPEGDVYVMQTYSQIVDPSLTMADLPTLGSRMALPPGWEYRVVVPTQDLVLSAEGVAHLVQDDLTNSYQRMEGGERVSGEPPVGK